MSRFSWFQPAGAVVGTIVWILLWSDVSVANAIAGFVLACLVMAVFPLPGLVTGVHVHPLGLMRLLGRFAVDLVVAAVEVAWLAVRPGPAPVSGMMRVRLRSSNDLCRTFTADLVTLVPGSVVVELDHHSSLLTVHVLGAGDTASLERAHANVLAQEERVLRALGSPADLAELSRGAVPGTDTDRPAGTP